jgi:hypothetical protein
MIKNIIRIIIPVIALALICVPAFALSDAYKNNIYNPGELKPVDSVLKVKVGEPAPDFTLPSIIKIVIIPTLLYNYDMTFKDNGFAKNHQTQLSRIYDY